MKAEFSVSILISKPAGGHPSKYAFPIASNKEPMVYEDPDR